MSNFNKYKSKLSQAFDDFNDKDRKELSNALNRALVELRNREKARMFKDEQVEHLGIEFELAFNCDEMYCKTDGYYIKIAASVPDWWHGWKKISKMEYIADIIDAEFHFIVQYIFRAHKLNLAAAIALEESINIGFFSSSGHYASYSDWQKESKKCIDNFFGGVAHIECKTTDGLKKMINRINCLDPDINKIVYYYLEANRLKDNGFWRSAITDLQSAVDAIVWYFRKRNGISGETSWQDVLISKLSFGSNGIESLENLYEFRNSFAAHPAHSKWWDFAELYGEEIDNCFDAVEDLLIATFDYENTNRIVEKSPQNWSKWYEDNIHIIADTIGFYKLPAIHNQKAE